jgi:hypothetical protein
LVSLTLLLYVKPPPSSAPLLVQHLVGRSVNRGSLEVEIDSYQRDLDSASHDALEDPNISPKKFLMSQTSFLDAELLFD